MKDVTAAWIAAWRPDGLGTLAGLAADGSAHHTMAGLDLDLDGFCDGLRNVFAAVPDIGYDLVHILSEGDLAAAYVVGVGTHAAPASAWPRPGLQ